MLNVVALIGRLTRDPELRYTPSNVAVASFSIAVDRSYVKQGAERQTDFINIVAWRSTAEFVCKYFKKGNLIAIQGSLQYRKYTDKDGNNRTAIDVVADNVHFVESKSASSGGGSFSPPQDTGEIAAPAFSSGDSDDFAIVEADDDLPF